MARVYSFWIFDRHCNPIYHQDWSHHYAASSSTLPSSTSVGGPASPTSPSASSSGLASIGATIQRTWSTSSTAAAIAAANSGSATASNAPSRSSESSLPGVTRAVARPAAATTTSAQQDQRSSNGSQIATSAATNWAPRASDALPFDEEAKLVYGVVFSLRNMVRKLGGSSESFNSYTTSTYTLAHLHTPTMYTFVILTDPVPPPSSIPSRSSDGYTIGSAGGARSGFGTGGGIPGTGGMSLKGVLMQIYRGPWVESVARNPLSTGLEREVRQVEASLDDDDDGDDDEGAAQDEDGFVAKLKVLKEGKVERTSGVDSDAFRDGIERVLAQNKLTAPPSAAS